jgi:hypothetical protein
MTDFEYLDISSRLARLEENNANAFVLGLYADLVRQHIDLLQDLVYNRFSNVDYENQMRLERDIKILSKSLDKLNHLLSKDSSSLKAEMEEIKVPSNYVH